MTQRNGQVAAELDTRGHALSALDAAHDLDALLELALSAARNLPGG